MLGTTEYSSVNVRPWFHGDRDLVVIELDGTLPGYYPIYSGSSEMDSAITMVGYGLRGEYNSSEGKW